MITRSIARARARLASQRGFTLVEVVASAAILIVVTTGVLLGFDAAGHFTSDQQQRTEANALARQDENRLRGMPVSTLASLSQTSYVTVNGTQFKIVSTGAFQTEATGSTSCSATGSADYILTSSVVSWTAVSHNGGTNSVEEDSVVTPQAGGALIVQVVNAQGTGVQNMSVTVTGPSNYSSTTGSNGCAIFAGLTGGTYNVSVSQPGYVDVDGNTTPPASKQTTTVIEGASDTIGFRFDLAGTLSATFTTTPYGASSPVAVNGDQISMVNTGMSYPYIRWAGTVGTYSSTVTGSNMFPFTSAYSVYAGSCSNDEPSTYGGTDQTVTVPAGGAGNLAIPLPPLNITVYKGSNTSSGVVSGAHVTVTDTGCGGSPPTAGGTPNIKRTFTANAGGQLANPGLPWGKYNICADNGTYIAQSNGVQSPTSATSPTSGATVNLFLNTTGGGTKGTCP